MNTTTDIPYGKIYLIKRKRSGYIIYVGQASRGTDSDLITREGGKWVASDRIGAHKSAASNGGGRKQLIDAHMYERGVDKFMFVTLPRHYDNKDDLNEAEKRYIKRFNTFNGDNPKGFNMTRGGQSGKDFVSPATRKKLSDAGKKRAANETPAQKKQMNERRSASQKEYRENETPVKKKQRSERQSASMKEHLANESPAKKKQRADRISATQMNKTPEEKSETTRKWREAHHNKNTDRDTCSVSDCLGKPRRGGLCYDHLEAICIADPPFAEQLNIRKCKARGCGNPGHRRGFLCNEHRNAKNREERDAKHEANVRVERLAKRNAKRK